MTTTVSFSDFVKTYGPLIGLIGGAISIVKSVHEVVQTTKKKQGEQAYETYVGDVLAKLGGKSSRSVRVEPNEQRWAARAVRERRLKWAPDGKGLMLPSDSNGDG